MEGSAMKATSAAAAATPLESGVLEEALATEVRISFVWVLIRILVDNAFGVAFHALIFVNRIPELYPLPNALGHSGSEALSPRSIAYSNMHVQNYLRIACACMPQFRTPQRV